MWTIVIMGGLGGLNPLAAQPPLATDPWARTAMAFVRHLEAGRFDSAAARIDSAVPAGALDAAALERIWASLVQATGPLVSLEPDRVTEQDGRHVVDLAARFERQTARIRVVYTTDAALSGLWLLPPAAPPYEVPAYVDTTAFEQIDINVGDDPWRLPGTLTIPRSGVRAVVVLVHGSGPNDRDETLGPNRPFRDIAWGLASRGIASLRYDKRTFVHAAKIDAREITVEEEVIVDAVAAIATVRAHPRTGGHPVFLLGHSLGAMLAPFIAERDGALAGTIMLAAPARPLLDVLDDQLAWIGSLDTTGAAVIRATRDSVRMLREGRLPPDASVLGGSVAYLNHVGTLDWVGTARGLDLPMLVLAGGRDYQVTSADLALWRQALAGQDRATIREYADLNHLFMPGQGRSTPAEYGRSGHVDVRVIDEIAEWIIRIALGG